jgi:hypothetical protein
LGCVGDTGEADFRLPAREPGAFWFERCPIKEGVPSLGGGQGSSKLRAHACVVKVVWGWWRVALRCHCTAAFHALRPVLLLPLHDPSLVQGSPELKLKPAVTDFGLGILMPRRWLYALPCCTRAPVGGAG